MIKTHAASAVGPVVKLVACCVLTLAATLVTAVQADDIAIADKDGITTLRQNGKLLLEYHSAANPTKIYVSRWFTPAGVQILRDSPHDHVHHRALMYAVGIDDVDFWSEVPPADFGRQVLHGSTKTSAATSDGRSEATIKQSIDWVSPGNETLASESRTITAYAGVVPHASLLTWQAELQPAAAKTSVKLWGRHYFGLGMRFVESMDKDGVFVTPGGDKGTAVRGSEQLTRANWCAFQAMADGKPVTVAMFDDPANPRHPATWFTMNAPFAYLSATLSLHEEPLMVSRDQPLRVKYGVAIWDGKIPAEQVEQAYQTWLKLPRLP